MFSMSFGSASGPVKAIVHRKSVTTGVAMLVLRTDDYAGEFTLFRDGPLALEQILDLGDEIVNACRKLMPAPEPIEQPMPFAINDAVDQHNALDAMPPQCTYCHEYITPGNGSPDKDLCHGCFPI